MTSVFIIIVMRTSDAKDSKSSPGRQRGVGEEGNISTSLNERNFLEIPETLNQV
jgi:hypothetical protein